MAFSVDAPLYFSVHSAVARLAPKAGAVVHVARYLDPGEQRDVEWVRRDLERFLDDVQPGWRREVVESSFAPRLVVSHDVGLAETGGVAGRAPVQLPDRDGVYLAGDWVGPEGLLADAAAASARAAAAAVLKRSRPGTVAA